MSEIRLLIADDSAVIRKALCDLLLAYQGKWRVCGEACDGQDALLKVGELNPDVLLLDLSIPVLRGAEVAKKLKISAPLLRIILMSEQESAVMELLAKELQLRHAIPKSRLMLDLVPQLSEVCREIEKERNAASRGNISTGN
jgi:two-component system, chemotaxis family, protein-glutamate methylesterase/glutaminase